MVVFLLNIFKINYKFQIVIAIFMDPQTILAMTMGSVHVIQIGWGLNVVFVQMSIIWQIMIA